MILMNRRKARENAVKLLFQMDIAQVDLDYALRHQIHDEEENPEHEVETDFFTRLVKGTTDNLTQIDEYIRKHLRGWKLERLSGVDRAILRLATYELYYLEDMPVGVTLNEAIELAKTFGTDESPKFINGVLSGLVKDSGKYKERL